MEWLRVLRAQYYYSFPIPSGCFLVCLRLWPLFLFIFKGLFLYTFARSLLGFFFFTYFNFFAVSCLDFFFFSPGLVLFLGQNPWKKVLVRKFCPVLKTNFLCCFNKMVGGTGFRRDYKGNRSRKTIRLDLKKESFMNRIKVWPHMTIVAVVFALVAGLGVYAWMKHEQTASAAELPYAARIQRVDGEVAFSDNRLTLMPLMRIKSGQPLLRINPSQREIGSTHVRTRTPRSRLADAISRGSIQTPRLTACRWETAALSSRCATARQCSTSGIYNLMNCLK